jgi:hypothetical protein
MKKALSIFLLPIAMSGLWLIRRSSDLLEKKSRKILVISAIALLLFISSLCSMKTVYGVFTPTLSSPAQTETTVTLSWTKLNELMFKAYQVEISSSANGPYGVIYSTNDSSQTSYAVVGLNPDTPYYFRVEDFSFSGTVITPPSVSNTLQVSTVPNPSISIALVGETAVCLRWVDYNSYTSVMPFIDYVIEVNASGDKWSTLAYITNVTQSTYNFTGLSPATCEFRIVDEVSTPTYLTDTSYYIRSFSNVVTLDVPQPTPIPTQAPNQTPITPEFPSLAILMLFVEVIIIVPIVIVIRKRQAT